MTIFPIKHFYLFSLPLPHTTMATNGSEAFTSLLELYKNFENSILGPEPDSQSLMDEILVLSFCIGLLNTWGDSSDMCDILSWIADTCKKRSVKRTCRKSPSECKMLETIFKVLRLIVCVRLFSPIMYGQNLYSFKISLICSQAALR